MSNKGQLLQDPFLNTLRKEHVPVSIYLVNGIKLQGQIESFDQYVVLLRNTVTQMVYKHAISTVVPARPVNLELRSQTSLSVFAGQSAVRHAVRARAIVVGVATAGGVDLDSSSDSQAELAQLAESAGGSRRPTRCQRRRERPDPALFAGNGKVEEMREARGSRRRPYVIFNHALSPAQQRNLEKRRWTAACSTAPS